MSFVKSQKLDHLADTYPNFLRRDLERALNLVFSEIIETLIKGKNVEIRGFGSFKTKQLKERIGRNPKDGSKIKILSKKKIRWKMSKNLLQKINQEKIDNE